LKQDRGCTYDITLRCVWIFTFWTVLRWPYNLIDRVYTHIYIYIYIYIHTHTHTQRSAEIFQKSKNPFKILGARKLA